MITTQSNTLLATLGCITIFFLTFSYSRGNQENISSYDYHRVSDARLHDTINGLIATSRDECSIRCSMNNDCKSFLWDTSGRTCTLGKSLTMNDGPRKPTGSEEIYSLRRKCSSEFGYQVRTYGDAVGCVFVSSQKANYFQAKQICADHGGRLIKANSPNLVTLVKEFSVEKGHLSTDAIFIGLDDLITENTFVWSDGTVLTDEERGVLLTSPQPDNFYEEDCIEISNKVDLKYTIMNDRACSTLLLFSCEKEL